MSLIYTAPARTDGIVTGKGTTRRNSVYLGGKADAKSRSKLENWGVTHILNVTPEKEAGIKSGVANYFESTSQKSSSRCFTYKRIPVYDAATSDLLAHADAAVEFISTALHHGSVLVHCQRGVSRSSTFVLFFLMRKAGMTLDEGLALCRRRRPEVNPIPAFMSQLTAYEKICMDLGLISKSNQSNGTGAVNSIGGSKRKRVIGVLGPTQRPRIGPSIGPSLPPSIDPSIDTKKTHKKDKSDVNQSVIGPLMSEKKTCAGTKSEDDFTTKKGDDLTKKASLIGPSLPKEEAS